MSKWEVVKWGRIVHCSKIFMIYYSIVKRAWLQLQRQFSRHFIHPAERPLARPPMLTRLRVFTWGESTAPVSWRRRWRLLDQGSISASGAMSPASHAWGSACKERSSLLTTRPRCWLWVSFYRFSLSLNRRDPQLQEAWSAGMPKIFSPRWSQSTRRSLPCFAHAESGGAHLNLRLVRFFSLVLFSSLHVSVIIHPLYVNQTQIWTRKTWNLALMCYGVL